MDIIQPWQLYLILQADRFSAVGAGIAAAASISGLLIAISIGMGVVIYAVSSGETGVPPAFVWKRKWILLLFYGAVLSLQLLSALMPSTKTAAIMFGVPAVVNNPTFQHETGEVYQLLKKALSDTVNKPEPPQEKKE